MSRIIGYVVDSTILCDGCAEGVEEANCSVCNKKGHLGDGWHDSDECRARCKKTGETWPGHAGYFEAENTTVIDNVQEGGDVDMFCEKCEELIQEAHLSKLSVQRLTDGGAPDGDRVRYGGRDQPHIPHSYADMYRAAKDADRKNVAPILFDDDEGINIKIEVNY